MVDEAGPTLAFCFESCSLHFPLGTYFETANCRLELEHELLLQQLCHISLWTGTALPAIHRVPNGRHDRWLMGWVNVHIGSCWCHHGAFGIDWGTLFGSIMEVESRLFVEEHGHPKGPFFYVHESCGSVFSPRDTLRPF